MESFCANFISSCTLSKYLHNKLSKYDRMCGIIRRTSETENRKEIQLKFYEVVVLRILLCGNESWTVKARDISTI
jgi:hypothetical protein